VALTFLLRLVALIFFVAPFGAGFLCCALWRWLLIARTRWFFIASFGAVFVENSHIKCYNLSHDTEA
jgi:hypothetical protein